LPSAGRFNLFEGASLWRTELLERIHRVFVVTPDEGERSFIDKFRDQIKPAVRRWFVSLPNVVHILSLHI